MSSGTVLNTTKQLVNCTLSGIQLMNGGWWWRWWWWYSSVIFLKRWKDKNVYWMKLHTGTADWVTVKLYPTFLWWKRNSAPALLQLSFFLALLSVIWSAATERERERERERESTERLPSGNKWQRQKLAAKRSAYKIQVEKVKQSWPRPTPNTQQKNWQTRQNKTQQLVEKEVFCQSSSSCVKEANKCLFT